MTTRGGERERVCGSERGEPIRWESILGMLYGIGDLVLWKSWTMEANSSLTWSKRLHSCLRLVQVGSPQRVQPSNFDDLSTLAINEQVTGDPAKGHGSLGCPMAKAPTLAVLPRPFAFNLGRLCGIRVQVLSRLFGYGCESIPSVVLRWQVMWNRNGRIDMNWTCN